MRREKDGRRRRDKQLSRRRVGSKRPTRRPAKERRRRRRKQQRRRRAGSMRLTRRLAKVKSGGFARLERTGRRRPVQRRG